MWGNTQFRTWESLLYVRLIRQRGVGTGNLTFFRDSLAPLLSNVLNV